MGREGEQASLAGPWGRITQVVSFFIQSPVQSSNEAPDLRDWLAWKSPVFGKEMFNSLAKQPIFTYKSYFYIDSIQFLFTKMQFNDS